MSTKSLSLHVGAEPTLLFTEHAQKLHPIEHPFCMRALLILGTLILTWLGAHSGSMCLAERSQLMKLRSNHVANKSPP